MVTQPSPDIRVDGDGRAWRERLAEMEREREGTRVPRVSASCKYGVPSHGDRPQAVSERTSHLVREAVDPLHFRACGVGCGAARCLRRAALGGDVQHHVHPLLRDGAHLAQQHVGGDGPVGRADAEHADTREHEHGARGGIVVAQQVAVQQMLLQVLTLAGGVEHVLRERVGDGVCLDAAALAVEHPRRAHAADARRVRREGRVVLAHYGELLHRAGAAPHKLKDAGGGPQRRARDPLANADREAAEPVAARAAHRLRDQTSDARHKAKAEARSSCTTTHES
eukprot:1342359-Pleurochrysis_carterae.AAC.3